MAVHTDIEKTSFTFVPASGQPIRLTYGEDYVTKDQTGAPSVDLDAPIVFVGYGINAPEYQWNDFAGLDVKGKILLAIVNEPPSTDENFSKAKLSPTTAVGPTSSKKQHAEARLESWSSTAPTSPAMDGT